VAPARAAGWRDLDDLRLLFPIPELDERRRTQEEERARAELANDETKETRT
jgi:hypothetical protein